MGQQMIDFIQHATPAIMYDIHNTNIIDVIVETIVTRKREWEIVIDPVLNRVEIADQERKFPIMADPFSTRYNYMLDIIDIMYKNSYLVTIGHFDNEYKESFWAMFRDDGGNQWYSYNLNSETHLYRSMPCAVAVAACCVKIDKLITKRKAIIATVEK